jgi:GT2 family glycosyltransferase
LFDTSFYRRQNSDVAARGVNPLVHYLEFGASEGRDPHRSFQTLFYLEAYPDVKGKINPLQHYWLYGRAENRRIAPSSQPSPEHVLTSTGGRNENRLAQQSEVVAYVAQPGPPISVVVPTYNTPPRYLRLAIDSVRKQTYPNWQLCIYDDGSTKDETLQCLREIAALDHRISVQFGSANQGIARASNAALAMAQGEYIAMLDHDDELASDALYEVAQLLLADWTIDVVYTDQQYIGPDSERQEPFFKPDWSPDLFRGVMFVGHLLVVRLELARKLGGFDPKFDRVQDFEFMLRVSESTKRIRHLPKVLYYWRRIPGSVAFGGDEKGKIEQIQSAAVNWQLSRLAIPALGEPHPRLAHRLTIEAQERTTFPAVNVIVRNSPGQGWPLECLRSVVEHSTYPNLTFTVSADLVLPYGPSNYRTRVRDAWSWETAPDADFTIWIDADLEVLTTDWIERLLLYCEQADIVCAAPLVTLPNGTVWNSGLVLGMDGPVGFPMRGLQADSDGYAGSLSCAREVSAVSGECFMISSASLSEVGGLVKYYQTSLFQGADISLRAFTMKRRNIVTPRVRVRKTGKLDAPLGWDLDQALFSDRWAALAKCGDPYYNPNFELSSPGFSLLKTFAAQST